MKWHSINDKQPEPGRRIAVAATANGQVLVDAGVAMYDSEEKLLADFCDDPLHPTLWYLPVFKDNGDVWAGEPSTLYCENVSRFYLINSDMGRDYTDGEGLRGWSWTYGED